MGQIPSVRWRKTATVFLSCLLASALPAEAAKKEKVKHPPSTEDERREMVSMAHYLEDHPLAEDAQEIRRTVVTFFRDVPDIKIKVCNMVPELLHSTKKNFNIILFTQGVVSKSAFVAANPELAHDSLLANMAGLVGILRAYRAVVVDQPEADWPVLDALIMQSPKGELPAFVTERTMECEEDLAPDDEGKTDKAEAAADHLRYGNKFFDQGDYQLALIEYTRAGRLAPDKAYAYELAQVFYSLENYPKARAYGEQSVKLDPKCSLCYQGLGNIYDDSEMPYSALDAYHNAIQLAPESGHPLYNYALTLERLGRRTEAIAALRTAVKVEPSYASPHRLLGTFLAANHEFYEADTEFHQFLRLEPPGDRYDEVVGWLKPAVHLDPAQIRPRQPAGAGILRVRTHPYALDPHRIQEEQSCGVRLQTHRGRRIGGAGGRGGVLADEQDSRDLRNP